MKIFVTADMHFNHANIIKYCKRPFEDVDDMNNSMITDWNMTVSKDDMVYHIGDFCFRKEIGGIFQGINYWKSKLNGDIIFLSGNHDKQISVKEVTITHNGKNILMRHNPIYHDTEIPNGIDYVLCGHVHDKWRSMNIGKAKVINVGIDVSNFKPNQLAEVVK